MSGPYTLAACGDAIFTDQLNEPTLNFVLITESYQHAHGNLSSSPTGVFEAQYASGVPVTTPTNTLRQA
jgi:hypothetical protein